MFDDLPYNGASTTHDFRSHNTKRTNCNKSIPALAIWTRHINGPGRFVCRITVVLDLDAGVIRMNENFLRLDI